MIIGNKSIQNLEPLWPEAPRYCPQISFPSYRFVPGLNPHPSLSRGEIPLSSPPPPSVSSGRDRSFRPVTRNKFDVTGIHSLKIPPDQWQENEIYLFGVDLYHQGYLWESHEAWEALWHLTDKKGVEGQFFQGLIQNSAALLK